MSDHANTSEDSSPISPERDRRVSRRRSSVAGHQLPLAADSVALLLLLWWLHALAQRLQEQSGLNVVVLASGYVLLCLGVYVIRKLEVAPAAPTIPWFGAKVRGALGALFGLAMMTAVAWQLGFFNVALTVDPMALGEGEAASFFVFAPSAWLGMSLFYVIVLAFSVTPSVRRGAASYPWLALAALLGVNAMLLLVTAQLQALRAEVVIGSRFLWFIASFVTLLLLFAPPRLLYLLRQPRLSAVVGFLILLGSCAWWVAVQGV